METKPEASINPEKHHDLSQKSGEIKKRIRSFACAFKGIRLFIFSQTNAKIQLVAGLAAITAGLILDISMIEWLIIAICIGSVLCAEAINTAIEMLVNLVQPSYNEQAGKIKDMSAGAVLLMSIAALICGLIIFISRIIELFFLDLL